MTLTKKKVEKMLEETKNDCENKKEYCWIEKKHIIEAIKLDNVEVVERNVDQKDNTYKTVVKFKKRLFVYVGDKI